MLENWFTYEDGKVVRFLKDILRILQCLPAVISKILPIITVRDVKQQDQLDGTSCILEDNLDGV